MGEWDFLDKYIKEESDRVDSFYFDDPLMELNESTQKKKAGRPKETALQKGNRALRKAKSALSEAMKRLEVYRAGK